MPTRYDLLHLNKDGTMNLIAPDIRHMSGEVILLASPGENQTRVIHLDDAGNYRQHLYSGN